MNNKRITQEKQRNNKLFGALGRGGGGGGRPTPIAGFPPIKLGGEGGM